VLSLCRCVVLVVVTMVLMRAVIPLWCLHAVFEFVDLVRAVPFVTLYVIAILFVRLLFLFVMLYLLYGGTICRYCLGAVPVG